MDKGTVAFSMPIDANIAIYVLAGTALILLIWVIRLELKIKRLLRGRNSKSIEDTINAVQTELDDYQSFKRSCGSHLSKMDKRLARNVAGVKTIRYNPFKGTGGGGNNSFSTAFVDETGNGVVITCLHARERMSVFAKPIEHRSSSFELSEEERQAVEEACRKADV